MVLTQEQKTSLVLDEFITSFVDVSSTPSGKQDVPGESNEYRFDGKGQSKPEKASMRTTQAAKPDEVDYAAVKDAAGSLKKVADSFIKQQDITHFEDDIDYLYENNANVSYEMLKSNMDDLLKNEEEENAFGILLELLRRLAPTLGTRFVWPCKDYIKEKYPSHIARSYDQYAKGSEI